MKNLIKYGITAFAFVMLIAACQNSQKVKEPANTKIKSEKSIPKNKKKNSSDKFPELTPEEHYHAIVSDSMTLAEVAKVNNIGLPFLKTKLGIPQQLNYGYPVSQLKKNFRFTTEQLKTIIEDAKNRSRLNDKIKKSKHQNKSKK